MSSTAPNQERRHLARREVLDLLQSDGTAALEGLAETDEVDFKGSYDLSGVQGRRDLVGDIASFANHRGGVLVVGVRTTKDLTSDEEFANAPTGLHTSSVEKQKTLAIIRDHVRPLVRDVEIKSHSLAGSQGDRVVITIDVPPQDQSVGPFIVQLMAHDDDTKRIRGAIGWPIRTGTDTYWHTADQIQGLLRSAHNSGLGATVERGAARGDRASPGGQPPNGLEDFLEALSGHDDWGDRPCLVFRACPIDAGVEIQSFFDQFRRGIDRWQGLRGDYGFNLHLTYPGIGPIGNDRLRRIDSRVAVQVSRAGEVLAAALGTQEFLGFGQDPRPDPDGERIRINAFALAEFTAEALRFAFEYVGERIVSPTWAVTAYGRRFVGPWTLELAPGFGLGMFPSDFKKAEAPDFDTITIESNRTAGQAALALLVEIYSQEFRLGADDVPFQRGGAVDLELLAEEANRR